MRNLKTLLTTSVCVLSLSACVSFQDYIGAPTIVGADSVQIESFQNERFKESEVIEQWWQTLADENLDLLIKDALSHNKDIDIARANLDEARAISRETGLDQYPTVTSNSSFKKNRTSGELGQGTSQTTNAFNTEFDASWEADLFGRVSERVKSDQAKVKQSYADLRNVHVTITAEVARVYMELRGAQHRLNIAERNAKNQKETYSLTKKLARGGRGTELDVSRAKTQWKLTQSTIPSFQAQVNSSINRLSVLTGQVPNTLNDILGKRKSLPSVPQSIQIGTVSDLLRRRPDVQSAEYALEASVADYNVSVANQFPVVSVTGAIGFAATTLSSFGSSAITSSLLPSVSWSAFDLGRVYSQIDQNDARARAATAQYEKTVLTALEELQTSVSNFAQEERKRAHLQQAARSAKDAVRLARSRYEAGVDTFIDALSTEATLLQAEDQLAASEVNTALNLITIYKALGGGWDQKQK